ncbi:riboflavin biosynthesis protein RibF [Pacificimonas flava]|uniref:Riboflavin biosynthesis protein n=2 Tax=Pacificimonas TaxID=1960290 RepID=A0A219B3J4_9SPHN|nr:MULTISPECIES: bifunctional riboflavin kinase/FAD synthetase [Pacificimonas]MBZ6377340.1 bifunctional riboflavin kinase/FAD synthetase [Pacificimonas aurantium]OWV32952.1 riboflavin biosynthesis protein RibF [Pacificimonas flava]
MKRIFMDDPLPRSLTGGVAALGNFDGFHAGHQAVVGEARYRARAKDGPSLVITFDPHPVRLFKPDMPPMALTTIDQRLDYFERFGIDGAVVLRFDREMAAMEPKAFVRDVLADRLSLSGVVTGDDFTFGARASGTIDDLRRLGEAAEIDAATVSAVNGIHGHRISSTKIREALREGDCDAAARMLTRPFTIRAEVEHGAKLGRTLGTPTANMRLGTYVRPKYGVYAVRGCLPSGECLDGVANLGVRPMIDPPVELLESWFFDWEGDLYGQTIDVELIAYLREERKLDGLEALKEQIARDAEAAKAALDARPADR